jgi:hypothetical protein
LEWLPSGKPYKNDKGKIMHIRTACTQLESQGQAIITLANNLSNDEACWKPDPDSWSIIELLNHLVDEETLDFRRHLDHILHTPNQPWPEIDPMSWVTAKHYNQRHLDETLSNFKTERAESLTWLVALPHPNWDAQVTLPWGTLTAGDMLASWVAHDLLHLRQLVAIRYWLTAAASRPYQVGYAGKW